MASGTRSLANTSDDGVDDRIKRYVEDAMDKNERVMEALMTCIANEDVANGEGVGSLDVKFFLIDTIPEDQKVRLLFVYLFDKALMWHRQFLKVHGENVTWPIYRDAIIQSKLGSNSNLTSTTTKSLMALPNTTKSYNVRPNTNPPRKQLSQKEYEEKRSKNLCFYCDNEYVPGHKCKGQLFTLVVLADQEEQEEEFVNADENLNEMETEEVQP
nr:hypothetical protein [Tanacetum cinerariifolium]